MGKRSKKMKVVGSGGQTLSEQAYPKLLGTKPTATTAPPAQKGYSGACAKTHPVLKFGPGRSIQGGSCHDPHVTDADVYVGLSKGMKMSRRHWPWEEGDELLYPMDDRQAPNEVEQFTRVVDWTLEQVDAGRSVFVGCMGGHGRTGLFLTALVLRSGFETDDALAFVRENYCKKAVETDAQIAYLEKNFGLKTKEEPSKPAWQFAAKRSGDGPLFQAGDYGFGASRATYGSLGGWDDPYESVLPPERGWSPRHADKTVDSMPRTVRPVTPSKKRVW